MCLGNEARAANERAKRDYEYKLQKREADWMQTLSLTKAEHIQYEEGVEAGNLGLLGAYGDIEAKRKELIGKAFQENEKEWKEFLQSNTGAEMAASGQTGRSADRIATLDLADYLRQTSRRAHDLTEASRGLSNEAAKAAGQERARQQQMFADVAFVKHPDLAPPKPVYQNVGMAAFRDALSIGTSIATVGIAMGSDRKLKENIKKIGESISGLGIYKFNYIGQAKQYIGTMADEVIKVVPEAVVTMSNGYQGVRYDLIDVTFKEA